MIAADSAANAEPNDLLGYITIDNALVVVRFLLLFCPFIFVVIGATDYFDLRPLPFWGQVIVSIRSYPTKSP
jgi:hypothetical protein